MRTTIKDIARQTNLSITTVSLVLNNKGQKIPEETKRLIFDAVEAMNYRPNKLALSLLRKKTYTIGLIIPDISNIFFSELGKGVEDRCREDSYNMILCNSNDEFLQEKQSINILADRSVDGIVIVISAESFGVKYEECLSTIRATGIPAILADCFDKAVDFSTIAVDNHEGSRLAMRHLIELGHRKIGCITGPLGLKTNVERLNGYINTLEEFDIQFEQSLVHEGNFRYQSGYDGTVKLLAKNPTAIFCHNDMMAYGAAKALKDRGYSIPEDISVIGFDDIFFSAYMDVPLSTVKQPVYQMGRKSAELLLEEINGSEIPKQHILFAPELKIRKSAAPPRMP